jgi:hypothetical protein
MQQLEADVKVIKWPHVIGFLQRCK